MEKAFRRRRNWKSFSLLTQRDEKKTKERKKSPRPQTMLRNRLKCLHHHALKRYLFCSNYRVAFIWSIFWMSTVQVRDIQQIFKQFCNFTNLNISLSSIEKGSQFCSLFLWKPLEFSGSTVSTNSLRTLSWCWVRSHHYTGEYVGDIFRQPSFLWVLKRLNCANYSATFLNAGYFDLFNSQ